MDRSFRAFEGRGGDPIAPLEEAVALDSTFVIAYMLRGIGRRNAGQPYAAAAALTRAYALREGASRHERLRIEANYNEYVTRDVATARAAFTELLEEGSMLGGAMNMLSNLDGQEHGYEEAAQWLLDLRDAQGSLTPNVFENLATLQLFLGEDEALEGTFDQWDERYGAGASSTLRYRTAWQRGQWDRVLYVLDSTEVADPGSRDVLIARKGHVRITRGEIEEGLRLLESVDRNRGPAAIPLAHLSLETGRDRSGVVDEAKRIGQAVRANLPATMGGVLAVAGLLGEAGAGAAGLDRRPITGRLPFDPSNPDTRKTSMRHEFTAVYERDGKWVIAYCPEVPGANGQGQTKDEARESLAEAIVLILEDRREDGLRGVPADAERETILVEDRGAA